MERRMGLSSFLDFSKASAHHGYHATGIVGVLKEIGAGLVGEPIGVLVHRRILAKIRKAPRPGAQSRGPRRRASSQSTRVVGREGS